MANDDKQPGSNLASGSVILVALVATGTYLIHRDAPFSGSRPAMTDASIHEQAEAQTVDARLWQDPFAAVTKVVEKLGKSDHGQQCLKNVSEDKTCSSPLVTADSAENSEKGIKQSKDTLVIGVTMSAAPYSEDAEQRRRTRYAVLSGLERAGFVPSDAQHIGYFWLSQNHQTPAPLQPALSRLLQIYPAWSHSNWLAAPAVTPKPPSLPLSPLVEQGPNRAKLAATAPAVQPPMFALSSLLQRYEQGLNPREAIGGSPQVPSVPYEWFEEAPLQGLPGGSQSHPPRSILVLWLEEEILKNYPLEKISKLKTFLHLQKGQTFKIIGPYTSGILRDMVKEACSFVVEPDKEKKCEPISTQFDPSFLTDVQFYSYGASAPDALLLGKLSETTGTVERYFGKLDIQLQRTIASDDILADGIKTELELRNAKVGQEEEGDLALISEWDTFYGQTLPKAVEARFGSGKCGDGTVFCIHKLTYMRGLDGLTSMIEGTEERKQDKAAPQGEKQAGAAGFFKTPTDPNNLDRPVGQGQFDYLRRMSKDLHKTDDELRKKGRKIKAIGVLGSDVFDKLLVLQALRPEFPEALFFTTDFDEAFTTASELPWTRNLIIASSFGPTLNKRIQREVPSFRSTYQTSAFLATLAAIGDPDEKWTTPKPVLDAIDTQLSTPRIFEISRSGNVLSFAGDKAAPPARSPQNPDQNQEDCPGCKDQIADTTLLTENRSEAHGRPQDSTRGCEKSPHPWYCDTTQIQPDSREAKLFPTFENRGGILLAVGLAGGAFLGLGLLYLHKVSEAARFETWLGILVLVLGALMCLFWEPFALIVTRYGSGEPIAMLDGVSIWPTVLLRIFGIVLSIDFIWRSQDSLFRNLEKIASDLQLSPKPARFDVRALWKNIGSVTWNNRTVWKNIKGVFDVSLGSNPGAQDSRFRVDVAWRAYLIQERFWSRRFWRACLYTLFMFGIFMCILAPLLGWPTNPARGLLAFWAYKITTMADVVFMLFLTFFVFDATLFCLLFVNKLRRAKTGWPKEPVRVFNERMRLPPEIVHEWIDLEFVAKRTACIGWLIYYPFVLIALLIVSRSSMFANYAPSPTILVAQGISLSVVFGCAIMLWWAATAARDAAKQSLTDKIIWAKGPCTAVCSISGATMHTDSHANKRDTEQPALPLTHAGKPKDAAADPPPPRKDPEDNPRFAEQLESLLRRVDQLKDGAFGPFTQQPLVRAVLLPLGSFGWTALVENGMLPGV